MSSFNQKLQHSSASSPSHSPSPQPAEKTDANEIAASSQQFSRGQSSPGRITPPAAGMISGYTPGNRLQKDRTERSTSRPTSMVFQGPVMDNNKDTIPELLPIFTFLNSHANKLYQEGYFLKLNDLDIGE